MSRDPDLYAHVERLSYTQEGMLARVTAVLEAEAISASVVTLGEQVYGPMKSSRTRENPLILEQLRSAVALPRCDAETGSRRPPSSTG